MAGREGRQSWSKNNKNKTTIQFIKSQNDFLIS